MKRTFLDRLIEPIAPRWALSRAHARLAIQAVYEAGQPSRLHKTRNESGDANAQIERGALALRKMARHFDENYDIASGVLDEMTNKVIGTGIRPEPQVMNKDGTPAKEVNDALIALHRDWCKLPEVTWSLGYYPLQRLIYRSFARDGEVFAQLIQGTGPFLDHGTTVPFSLELLEADFVPLDYSVVDDNIIQGVKLNAWGRPRGYYVYKKHPGSANTVTSADVKLIPSERMAHLRFVKRLHQVRGVSMFAACLDRFDDIKEIDQTERVAARVAAAQAAFIKSGLPENFIAPTAPYKAPLIEIYPGMVHSLLPGQDVTSIPNTRPNNALIPFRKDQLRAVAAGTGTGVSAIAKDFGGTYSSNRQELVESSVAYKVLTDLFVDVFAQPVWERFAESAYLARLVKIGPNVDRATLYNASHSRPPLPWIDPKKEVEANALMEAHGYKSRSKIIRESGENPDDVNQEIVRDAAEEDRLKLNLRRDGAATPAEPAPPPEDPNEPEPAAAETEE